jgi:hypothetical protein
MADERQALVDAAWEWRAQMRGAAPRLLRDRPLALAVDGFRDVLLYGLRAPGAREREDPTKDVLVSEALKWRASMTRRDASCPLPRGAHARALAFAADAYLGSLSRRAIARASGKGPTAWDKIKDPAY